MKTKIIYFRRRLSRLSWLVLTPFIFLLPSLVQAQSLPFIKGQSGMDGKGVNIAPRPISDRTTFQPDQILTWAGLPADIFVSDDEPVIYVAHFFSADELAPMVGEAIHAVEFFYGIDDYKRHYNCKHTLCIWGDKERNTLLLEQPYVGGESPAFVRLQLTQPFVIPAEQDLYIGLRIENPYLNTFCMVADGGPAVVGKGDLFAVEGAPFASLYETTGDNINFFLRAFTDKAEAVTYTITYDQPANGEIELIRYVDGDEEQIFEEGVVVSGESYMQGSIVQLYAYADSGYTLDELTVNGVPFENYSIFILDSNTVIETKFITDLNDVTGWETNKYKVFPNPVVTALTLQVPESVVGQSVELCDLSGKVLLVHRLQSSKQQINLEHLPSGAYLLKVGKQTFKIEKH